jgi:OOP family OmpA-OmpF porin
MELSMWGFRRGKGFWVTWGAAVLSLCGCAMSNVKDPAKRRQWCIINTSLLGAAAGGATGGFIAGRNDFSKNGKIALPAGIVGGALVGGLIGYFTCPSTEAQAAPAPAAPAPPAPPPPPPPAPPAAPAPSKIILRGVHFDFDKSAIRPVDEPVLDEAAEVLKQNPNLRVEVNGYTDAVGTEAYNLKLSERRADAVAAYLENHGIAADRLTTHGYGKTHFVASNDTAEGRAQNRRVELVPIQ